MHFVNYKNLLFLQIIKDAACGDDNNNENGGGGGGNGAFVEDTRIWYAVGDDTKGTMKANGWKPFNSDIAFTRDTTKTDENVFTLSLDIYAGNVGTGKSFKFLYKTSADEEPAESALWARQVGMQHLAGIEGSDADTILKMDGKTVFTTANDNGAYNNIALAKGQEGRYKFTLKTKSNTDNNPVITVEKESSIAVNYDMYVIGDNNNFGTKGKVELTENIVEGSATTWVGKLEVTAADLYRNADGSLAEDENTGDAAGEYAAVCLLNDRDAKTFAPVEGDGVIVKEVKNFAGNKTYTCVLLKEGKYNVVFTEDTTDGNNGSVAITESAFEMYIIGSMTGGWNEATACTPDYAMTEQSDGTWTKIMTFTEDGSLKAFNNKGIGNKYSADPNVDVTAGTWAIKYDPETNAVTAEKLGYYIVGGYTDPAWGEGLTGGKCVKIEETEAAGTFSGEVELAANTEFKVVFGSVLLGPASDGWHGPAVGDPFRSPDNDNYKVTEAGTYTVTVTVTDGSLAISIAKKA